MQDGQRPVAVGFFFSLGHSTVVFLLSVLVAISAVFVKKNLPEMQNVGGLIGTSVSGVFLLVIAIINLIVLVDIYRTWQKVVRGGPTTTRPWTTTFPILKGVLNTSETTRKPVDTPSRLLTRSFG